MSDKCIKVAELLKAIPKAEPDLFENCRYCTCLNSEQIADIIESIPPAQPEIIRCRDCLKREICRTTTIWAVAPGDDWYCADAERREE